MTKEPSMGGLGYRPWLVAVLVAMSLWPGIAVAASSITGTVIFDGKAPALKPLDMQAEAVCHKKHGGKPAPNEALVLGTGNAMANIMVWVSKGLPSGKTYPVPTTPVTLDQDGCQYKPHVMGIMVGQSFKVLNSDGILHNVHALPKVNATFNMAMPPTRKEASATFGKEEGMFVIKCDVHPWMQSYMGVFSHPFFAVTGPDGKFTIPNLPAGTYEIEAWHEKLGTQKSKVTVGASDTQTAAFKFAPPTK
jgi:plastocyanin